MEILHLLQNSTVLLVNVSSFYQREILCYQETLQVKLRLFCTQNVWGAYQILCFVMNWTEKTQQCIQIHRQVSFKWLIKCNIGTDMAFQLGCDAYVWLISSPSIISLHFTWRVFASLTSVARLCPFDALHISMLPLDCLKSHVEGCFNNVSSSEPWWTLFDIQRRPCE